MQLYNIIAEFQIDFFSFFLLSHIFNQVIDL